MDNLTENDIDALRGLADRIAAKPPEGSVTVVVMAGADDRFTLTPEDQTGAMDLATPLPDVLNRYDFTAMDLAMAVKDLDFWPAEITVIAE